MFRKSVLFVSSIFVFLSCVLISGCGGGTGAVPQTGFRYTLTVPKGSFGIGESVPLTFSVQNIGQQPVTISRAGCKFFDTKVMRGNQVVWQQSLTGGCGGNSEFVTINPGETKSYGYDWTQFDQNGSQVASGTYTVKSWFDAVNTVDSFLIPGNQEANEAAPVIQISIP